jgi:hypothetical protein
MIRPKAKEYYWSVVASCLREIHGMSPGEARRKCMRLRRSVEARPDRLARDLFYHHEPFDVACDLAEKPLDPTEYQETYARIREGLRPILLNGRAKLD